jgi:hypothetical protein
VYLLSNALIFKFSLTVTTKLTLQVPSLQLSIYITYTADTHVKWVPCHHGMARPQVADGGDGLRICRVAANILNKQSRTADKGWYSSLGIGREPDYS